MRASHPAFPEPTNPQIPIWRYMDFSKYVAMISKRALYFPRIDRLEDPFEGSTTIVSRRMLEAEFAKTLKPEHVATIMGMISESNEWMRQWTFVNCWHMNEGESHAMWKLYAHTANAVAIQSTYARLANCLPEKIYVGEVRYIDYDRSAIPVVNVFSPVMHKRRSFEHERELRAVWLEMPGEQAILGHDKNPENGHDVPVDLGQLVERVVVAPTAPSWFQDAVQSVTERYSCGFPVQRSTLDTRPTF